MLYGKSCAGLDSRYRESDPKGIGNGYVQEREGKTIAPMSELADNTLKSIHSLAFWPARPTVHLIRPLGLDWGAYTSASLPVFLIPLCQLRSTSKK